MRLLAICRDKRHWSIVTQPTKQRLLEEQRLEGEFWMDFNDFCREFEVATICTLGSDFGALPEIDNTPINVHLLNLLNSIDFCIFVFN